MIMSLRRGTGRRRKKRATDAADKWKNKIWLDIKTPEYIDEKILGTTPTSKEDSAIGRTIKISLMDLTNSFKDLNYQLIFRISEVTGNVARTEFDGQELSRDFKRSQIRNHRSQVEGIFNLRLSDNAKIRVKTFLVTPKRAHSSIKKAMRESIHQKMEEICSNLTFAAFVNKLITYEFTQEILPVVEAIYPIKIFEIAKVKVIRLPEAKALEIEV